MTYPIATMWPHRSRLRHCHIAPDVTNVVDWPGRRGDQLTCDGPNQTVQPTSANRPGISSGGAGGETWSKSNAGGFIQTGAYPALAWCGEITALPGSRSVWAASGAVGPGQVDAIYYSLTGLQVQFSAVSGVHPRVLVGGAGAGQVRSVVVALRPDSMVGWAWDGASLTTGSWALAANGGVNAPRIHLIAGKGHPTAAVADALHCEVHAYPDAPDDAACLDLVYRLGAAWGL